LISLILVAAAVAAGIWLVVVIGLLLVGRRTHARELAMLVPNLVRLFRGLLGDRRIPRRTRWLLLAGVAWFASPIDLIPEFIPVLGPLDDAIVAAMILRHIVKVAGPQVVGDHWPGDPATLERIMRLIRVESGRRS
jgi:uncharacterized membrane protein YkvA (DUF1232 family)